MTPQEIKEKRLAALLSQTELARLAGISRVVLNRIENGADEGVNKSDGRRVLVLEKIKNALQRNK